MTAKSPSGRVLFHDDRDRQRYLQLIAREVREREWRLLTYCQLTNHVHALVHTPHTNLGDGIKRAHEDFARYINQRHGQGGHVFGSRFDNRLVSTDRHAVACLRYIARNPVDAGMCGSAREWPWSAHRALAGLVEPPGFLDVEGAYAFLGADEPEARLAYLQLVAKSNGGVLAELRSTGSDAWLPSAVDEFGIPMVEIAAFLGIGRSTAYRRLAAARENEGTVPSFSGETVGTVP